MTKMILSMDGLVLKEITLAKERMTIGRRPSNDIQIDNLAISGEHAVVVTILNDSFLEDLNSTNGTLVNGQPVKKHFLKNGDVIELGKYKLKYVTEQKPVAGVDAGQAGILRPSIEKRGAPAAVLAVEPRAAQVPKTGHVRLLNGANAGRELALTKTLTTVGKPGVHVAVIARRPQGYTLTHVEGKDYPGVNGRSIGAEPQQLADKDVIEIAGIRMEFFLRDPA